MTTAPTTAIRRLAVSRAVATTGYEAGWIALMVAVFARTHSTVWMSAALFAAIATSGLAAPVAGALGDRYDRRRVMIASELGAAVFAAAMVVASAPALLVGLAALVGLAEAPFMPASSAAVPNLVPDGSAGVGQLDDGGRSQRRALCWGRWRAACSLPRSAPSAVFGISAVAFLIAGALVASVHRPLQRTSGRSAITIVTCGPGSSSSGARRCCAG